MSDESERRSGNGSTAIQYVFRGLAALCTAVILTATPAFFELRERVSLLQAELVVQRELKADIKVTLDKRLERMEDNLIQESRRWEAIRGELVDKMDTLQPGQGGRTRYRERVK